MSGVFVNIFGGILRCDVLASGVVNAAKELKFKVPVVVRMEGTNVQQGQEILRNSGLNFTVASGMKDGAEKIVARWRSRKHSMRRNQRLTFLRWCSYAGPRMSR